MQSFLIAKVLKPQGIQGEIKVEFFVSDLNFAKNLKSFFIENQKFTVKNIRINGKYGFIKTLEVLDRNQAENLRSKQIFVEEEKKPKLDNFEFFIKDLENCCVVDENDKIIGYVESIEQYGSADIINILMGGAIKSFPFLKNIVKSVDIENKKITVFKKLLKEVLV